MATLVLGAVGAGIGGSIGGSVLGMSAAVIGRAAGSAAGRVIDQVVLGRGGEPVEQGRVDRFRLNGASEGAAIPRVFGRVRVGASVIWASRFRERRETTGGGGKGAPKAPKTTQFRYSISLALALCEGEILRVGRIWADGEELARDTIQMRVHSGAEDQLPDSLIEAMDGEAPAYRGTAYVVIEDLDLTPFGNRVPQFSFEVVRMARDPSLPPSPAECVQGVALVPGTGEYALATTSVHYDYGDTREAANVNTVQGRADFPVALGDLAEELPALRSASLVVSWFGDDLRCGRCRLRPKVEQKRFDGQRQPWIVSGLDRAKALDVPSTDGRPVYGGTPSDRSVVESIRALNGRGIDVTFYPFILMEQMIGNGLPDPWGGDEQAHLPWRGRITTDLAPGREGTSDQTADAADEVSAFFGDAEIDDFILRKDKDGVLDLVGPHEWSYRRFILHYAHLCALAGGVEAFCIGSEMRSLTRIRGQGGAFPAVDELRRLAADVRRILPNAKIGYAADWSEYYGYHPADTGDLLFHLDPLWADPSIDFVGIDNYMPLSDWRDGTDHQDWAWGSCHNVDYLRANIEGGEGYDWYYPTPEARLAQRRVPITDGAEGEPWVWRYKDLRSWWSNPHHERRNGVRDPIPTGWVPRSKPIRFTEYGCAAIDKGANQPNKFVDPKSSESALPHHSTGRRDDAMQLAYLQAMQSHWGDPANNVASDLYRGPMIDMEHSFVWAWDARPYPAFPELSQVWADSGNHARGHWFSGRSGAQPLATVIAELCRRAGLQSFDVSRVRGVVRGMTIASIQSARADLQPLMMAHAVEAVEREGTLVFSMRSERRAARVERDWLVRMDGPTISRQIASEPESAGRVRVHHMDAGGDFDMRVGDAAQPGGTGVPVMDTEVPFAMTSGEGHVLAERFLAESRIARDTVDFTLPPSRRDLRAGDLVAFDCGSETWRIDRIEDGLGRTVTAMRTELDVYDPSDAVEDGSGRVRPLAPLPADAIVMDLPLLTGDEVPHAPHVAIASRPWSGTVAIHSSGTDANYTLDKLIDAPSLVGRTENVLNGAAPGIWDRGTELLVRLPVGALSSATDDAVLAGANAVAIGGEATSGWEIFQFRDARLVAPGLWGLSMRLRGQRGTEANMCCQRPVGSRIVVLDGAPEQLPLSVGQLGSTRHLRIGPAALPLDHEAYEHEVIVPQGEGLRPYAPAHLRIVQTSAGVRVSWVRRSRIPVDPWGAGDVPLGEVTERFRVEWVAADDSVITRVDTVRSHLDIELTEWEAHRTSGADRVRVAQLSEVFGPGHWAITAIA